MRDKVIKILNAQLKGEKIELKEIMEIVSNFLTETKPDEADKMISVIASNPQLIQNIFPEMVDYYKEKLELNHISKDGKILIYL